MKMKKKIKEIKFSYNELVSVLNDILKDIKKNKKNKKGE